MFLKSTEYIRLPKIFIKLLGYCFNYSANTIVHHVFIHMIFASGINDINSKRNPDILSWHLYSGIRIFQVLPEHPALLHYSTLFPRTCSHRLHARNILLTDALRCSLSSGEGIASSSRASDVSRIRHTVSYYMIVISL